MLLSRRVCPASLGLHPPLGSARYVDVRGRGVSVWGEGGKEQAILFYDRLIIFTPLHPHPLPSSQECRGCSSLLGAASQLGWDNHRIFCLPWPSSPSSEHSPALWHLPVSTVVWVALVSCPTANWPPHILTLPQNLPSSSVLQLANNDKGWVVIPFNAHLYIVTR